MRATFFLALFALLAGCATPQLSTPKGFVALEKGEYSYNDYTYKAVSPDGAVLQVRYQEEQPKGEFDFWAEALQRELTEGLGYELISEEEIRTDKGEEGRVMRFRGAHQGQVFRYGVAVFVEEEDDDYDNVITVEYGVPEGAAGRA